MSNMSNEKLALGAIAIGIFAAGMSTGGLVATKYLERKHQAVIRKVRRLEHDFASNMAAEVIKIVLREYDKNHQTDLLAKTRAALDEIDLEKAIDNALKEPDTLSDEPVADPSEPLSSDPSEPVAPSSETPQKEGYISYAHTLKVLADEKRKEMAAKRKTVEMSDEEWAAVQAGAAATPMETHPYVMLSAELFSTNLGYSWNSLIYYADGVLTDKTNEPLEKEDILEMVGADFANHFGEDPDEPDIVFVRNDELEADYEIVKDLRTWAKYSAQLPPDIRKRR